jgi:YggT family protein
MFGTSAADVTHRPSYRPTEPFLKFVRGITPPLFGVDISPIVVYAVLSFIREICLGQQGVLTMLAMKDL